jgi:hypothetical protein
VLQANSTSVPEIQRAGKAEPYRQQILELLIRCKGNLVRVHEELAARGAEMSYPALTPTAALQSVQIRKLYRTGLSKAEIARRLKIGRTSVRRVLG